MGAPVVAEFDFIMTDDMLYSTCRYYDGPTS